MDAPFGSILHGPGKNLGAGAAGDGVVTVGALGWAEAGVGLGVWVGEAMAPLVTRPRAVTVEEEGITLEPGWEGKGTVVMPVPVQAGMEEGGATVEQHPTEGGEGGEAGNFLSLYAIREGKRACV
jgi:hypothetical protein